MRALDHTAAMLKEWTCVPGVGAYFYTKYFFVCQSANMGADHVSEHPPFKEITQTVIR